MTTAIETQRDDPRDSYRARRTEAMPKHSLFGSSLEIQDEQVAQQLQNIDPKTTRVPKTPTPRGPGLKFVLPEDVKENLPGAQIYEKSRRKVDSQSEVAKQVNADLRKKEEEALYRLAQTGYDNYQPAEPSIEQGTARSQWFTQKDLAGAKHINILGLNKNQSYNRDKYGPRAPVHNYSLIGDILRPGMDFPRRERTEVQMRNLGYGKGDLRGALVTPPPPKANQSARTPRHSSITLPPNIKHQFGSRVCDNLLADKDVVEKTIKKQKDFKASIQRTSKPFDVPKFTKEMNPEYEMLGNALRMNVVPGYSTDHKISTTKTSFNDQVHLFRYPDPDKYRYQKDELSTWAEHNVLRQRMTKAWEAYFIETLNKKQQK